MKKILLPLLTLLLTLMMAALPAQGATAKKISSGTVKKKVTVTQTHKKKHLQRVTAKTDPDSEFVNFSQWKAVSEFITQMSEEHGFDHAALNAQFARTVYVEKVVKLINPPPAGKAKNWTAYRERFLDSVRIRAGLEFWGKYETELNRAQAEFGVAPEIIVGILGVETIYGRSTGNIRVMDALTTLSFAYPPTANRDTRMRYFRGELEQVLLYARESNIDPFSLSGSFAGAIGLPQFMPGSIRRFAVDFDGDGRIDLRNSAADAIGSIASFLSQHGWTAELPLVYPVKVDLDNQQHWQPLIGVTLAATHTTDELRLAGVTIPDQVPPTLMFGLVDLQDGERPTRYWVGSDNFFAITRYNRSFFYAMAVIELGNAIRQQRRL